MNEKTSDIAVKKLKNLYSNIHIYSFSYFSLNLCVFADSLQVLTAVQAQGSSSLKPLTESKLDFTEVM